MTRQITRTEYTQDDVDYIRANYPAKSALEIAVDLGLSKFHVTKIIAELRKQGEDIEVPVSKPVTRYSTGV